jgi:glycosyltransferase involved in cell wall biosynthesis
LPGSAVTRTPETSNTLKILITVPYGERLGGAENMLWAILRNRELTRIVPIVVFFQPGPFEREVADLGIQTVVIPSGRLRQLRRGFMLVQALAALLRSEQPDLILNWMPKTHLYGASAARLARMSDRLVWWQHGVPDGHWLDRLATIMPTRAIGCSSHAAARSQARMRPRRRTFVVHPGVESPEIAREEVSALREQLSIPDDAAVVGIVGRLQPWKGQDRFLQALSEIVRRGLNVHGLVVGGNAYDLSPGYEEHLHALVLQLGLERHVLFTGQIADPTPYIAAMDVLVNASAPEPFGLVVIEAMALGVPVVAVDAGGPAEIIEPGRSGLLVSANEPGLLADALERLVADAALRRRLGESARERYLDRFTAGHMGESLQRRLEELAR